MLKRCMLVLTLSTVIPAVADELDMTSASFKMCEAIPSFFDEAWYLTRYTDVARVVAQYDANPAHLRCGWQHWWLYGRVEGRRMSARDK